jgi:hypothetical protein
MDAPEHITLDHHLDVLADVDLRALGKYGQGLVKIGRKLEAHVLAFNGHSGLRSVVERIAFAAGAVAPADVRHVLGGLLFGRRIAQHAPCHIGSKVFAPNRSVRYTLNRWAVLSRNSVQSPLMDDRMALQAKSGGQLRDTTG